MKNFPCLVSILLCICGVCQSQKTTESLQINGNEKTINSDWTFNYFATESAEKGYEAQSFDDSRWSAVSLPHTWNTFETTGEIKVLDDAYWYKGWGWYRKHFRIKSDYTGKQVFIQLDGIQKYCKVWLNGSYLGDHSGGFGSFDFNITSLIKINADNVIAISVCNNTKISGSDYGGISGDVRIVIKNKLYIPMQGSSSHEGGTKISTPAFNGKTGIVSVTTWVQNDDSRLKNCTLKTTIFDAEGKMIQVLKTIAEIKPGELYKFEQISKPVKNPRLWTPAQPYLYKVSSEVYEDTRLSDIYTSPLGFRWFSWDKTDNSLYFNGQKMSMAGIELKCRNELLGFAVPLWFLEKNLTDLSKNRTFNYIRTKGDKLINLADKTGIIVDAGLQADENDTKENYEKQVKEFIRKNRNHPSVVFWNLGARFKSSDPSFALNEDSARIFFPGNPKVRSADPDELKTADISDTKVPATSAGINNTGEPVRVVVSSDQHLLKAERGSVALVNAVITDAQGNKIEGSGKVLSWTITGPARLIGPATSVPDESLIQDNNVLRYSSLPAVNFIRSTGETGKISVTVTASGLLSGTLEILTESLPVDNSLLSETVLRNEGRRRSEKNVLVASRLDDIPEEIKYLATDLTLSSTGVNGYKKAVCEHTLRNNQGIDTSSVEFRIFAVLLARYLNNNKGQISTLDYNFNARNFNSCRLISGYVNATKLPQPFKDALRKYYANAIIWQGEPRNAGDEMNWLNWIPSGGTVVIFSDNPKMAQPNGVLTTNKNKLTDIISLVHPGFASFSSDASERAIEFIAKMNPYVFQEKSGAEAGKEKSVVFLAEKGKPILIPLLKFISED